MRSRGRARAGLVLTVVAATLIIFGGIWTAIIFPSLDKVPADLKRSVQYEGTQKVLDPDTRQMVSYNVMVTRRFDAVKSRGDTVYLKEDISFVDVDTGQSIPSLHQTALLAIDRASRTNVPGHGDRNREGYWSFPRDVKADKVYPIWISGNPQTLDARYVGVEDFRGLHVLVYEIATPEGGLTIPTGLFTPETQHYQQITMKVEPVSGVTVYFETTVKRTSKLPVTDELFPSTGDMTFTDMTVSETRMAFTEETVVQLVHDGKFYRWALPWGNTYLPWTVFGLGFVLCIVAWRLVLRREVAEVPAVEPVDAEVARARY